MKAFQTIVLALILLFATEINAQDNYQIKKIEGKEYILYPVEPGEGVYGIARKFNVTAKELFELNTDANNGLKAGQILLIPKLKDAAKAAATENKPAIETAVQPVVNSAPKTDAPEYIEYMVEKRQTLFAISRKFEISQDDLKKYNPELENGLKTGMVLRIPKTTAAENSKTKKIRKDTKYINIKHIVKPKETLYAISKLYNIDVEDIIKLNPTALASLIIGSELTIQVSKEMAASLNQPIDKPIEQEKPKPQVVAPEIQYLTRITKNIKPTATPFKIAILLPLVIENVKTDAVNERFQEFYAGFLMAANEAKSKGVSLNIITFDTEKSEEKITQVLQNKDLKSVDLIIGPAYSNQIPYITEFAIANKINTIIPFSSKVSDITDNPYLLQFNPSRKTEAEYLTNILTQQNKNDNVIFINISDISTSDSGFDFSQDVRDLLKSKNRNFNFVELINEQSIQNSVFLDKEKNNIIIFNTDKFSSVYPYLSFLNANALNYNITLYEQYSWKNQNAQVKFKSFSIAPFKPLLNDVDFNNYNELFKNNFNWKLSSNNPRYDVLGYDLGNYSIAMLYEFGPQFGWGKLKLPLASGIQSYLKFERTSTTGGFINSQLYLHEK